MTNAKEVVNRMPVTTVAQGALMPTHNTLPRSRRIWILMAALCMGLIVPSIHPVPAQAASKAETAPTPPLSPRDEKTDFSFAGVFPKPFYQTDYFTLGVIGASMVVAGTITYFTAGAGAPVAATGVSTIASTIAGGGAGSYMAGLSIVGGWFGGNAMLGSAMLNGIAISLGAGGTQYTAMSSLGKASVLASISATALDGVFLYADPASKELVYRVHLPVPDRIGSGGVRRLVRELNETDAELLKIAQRAEATRAEEPSKAAKQDERVRELEDQRSQLLEKVQTRIETASIGSTRAENLLVLAVLSKNLGSDESFHRLLRRIPAEQLTNRSYLDYLTAITYIEMGQLEPSQDLLRKSWGASPYAIEPAILLVNVLGHKHFVENEDVILAIVERAEKQFDSDDYVSRYSLLALYYRVAGMYAMAERYEQAEAYYEKAYRALPWTQKYMGSKQVRNLIQLGIANSLFGQNRTDEANELFEGLLKDADTDEEKDRLRSQYAPNLQNAEARRG